MRCGAAAVEHGVVELLRAVPVFVPPLAQRRHIVSRESAHRTVRIAREIAELNARILRHRLQFETQNAQLLHNPLHAVGHHAQVFCAYQHTGSLHQNRQLLHRLAIPEIVVAAIIVVVIESVERSLVAVPQRLVHEVELRRDARVEEVGVLAVAYEEHVVNQRVESVAQPHVLLRRLALERSLNLALRVVFGLERVDVVVLVVEISLDNLLGMFAEHALHYPVGNERRCEEMLLEVETIALYLVARHGECRLELSEQSAYAVGRYSPYTEESEHMVDAVSVEILSHVLEAAHPPLASVCNHAVPVVCR